MSVDVPPSLMPRCSVHPEELAGGTCQRCGGFVCAACTTWVMGGLYCPTCAARPEVNYLEAFRQQYWGRRDPGTYLVGAGTLLFAWGAVVALLDGYVFSALALLVAAAVGGAYFLGRRWARLPMLLTPLTLGLLGTLTSNAPVFALALVVFIIGARLYLDPRGKLFFRVDLSEKELRRLWDREANNPLARHAVTLGLGGLFFPLFALAAIVLGFLALRRVDPQARPPIGRRGYAIWGIVLGVGALLLWGLVILPVVSGRMGWMFRH